MGQLLRQLRQLDLRILTQRMLAEPVLLNLGVWPKLQGVLSTRQFIRQIYKAFSFLVYNTCVKYRRYKCCYKCQPAVNLANLFATLTA